MFVLHNEIINTLNGIDKLALKKLKWKTKLNFNETMNMTSEWYYQFIFKKKIITFDQIRKFIKNYI